jgi:hypothetical protein
MSEIVTSRINRLVLWTNCIHSETVNRNAVVQCTMMYITFIEATF